MRTTRTTSPHRILITLSALVLALVGLQLAGQRHAQAATPGSTTSTTSTSQFKGVNWADQRDNFVNGVLYPSGLSSTDTYSSAATVADRVVGQLDSITGANTVRMPINEPTVSNYWSTYTGAIDAALTKGNVILAYWAYSGGKPASNTAFHQMWDTVVAKYASNANAYFEVINEPYAYSTTDLDNLYNDWLTRYPSVPRGRVILDGTVTPPNVAAVGGDSRLNNTLIAVHDYSFFGTPYNDENQWANGLAGQIGAYAGRTIATEWGAPDEPGQQERRLLQHHRLQHPERFLLRRLRARCQQRTADTRRGQRVLARAARRRLVQHDEQVRQRLLDRAVVGEHLRTAAVAVRLGHRATAAQRPSGSATPRPAWPWTDSGAPAPAPTPGSRRPAAARHSSGPSRTTATTYASRTSSTGLYLDGVGRTTNGAAVGQYSDTNSTSQQWTAVSDGNNVLIQNRATGLYIDGMGRTANGSDLGQYSHSNSTNQQWQIVEAG